MNNETYFRGRNINRYNLPLSEDAKLIIKEKPDNWEDKLFREVFRTQRNYLQSLWEIDPNSELYRYAVQQKEDEGAVAYLNNILQCITSRINSVNATLQETWNFYMDARGRGIPGNADEIVEAARCFFYDYIYHLEMRYDIESLDLPKSGEKIKRWFQNIINQAVKDVYEDLLNRVDYVADVLAEDKDDDLSTIFTVNYNFSVDANGLVADFFGMGLNTKIKRVDLRSKAVAGDRLTHINIVGSDQAGLGKDFEIVGNVLVNYKGKEANLVLPRGITVIGAHAFAKNKTLQRIVLPDGIDIKQGAFLECSKLEQICDTGHVWKAGSVEKDAFYKCKKLNSIIELSEKVVERDTFAYCSQLTCVLMQNDSVVERNAFRECKNLQQICPEGDILRLKGIDWCAFYGCKQLSSDIEVGGDGISSQIAQSAFELCGKLSKVYIRNNTIVDRSAFSGCKNLVYICPVTDVAKLYSVSDNAFYNCKKLISDIEIIGGKIGDSAFENCGSLSQVYLQKKCLVGEKAFCNCKKMLYLCKPGGIAEISAIGRYAFYNCTKMASEIEYFGNTVAEYAFSNCESIPAVYLNDGIRVESAAFMRCKKIKSISHGDTLVIDKIYRDAFYGCSRLDTCIKITSLIVEDSAFSGCERLTRVLLAPDTVIERNAFSNCSSLRHICPEGYKAKIRKLNSNAFNWCGQLESDIELENDILSEGAFRGCEKVENVSLPETVLIERSAFYRCKRLRQISAQGERITIDSIGGDAFYGCKNLSADIRLNQNLVEGGEFAYCSCIKSIMVPQRFKYLPSSFEGVSRMPLVKTNDDSNSIPKQALIEDNRIGYKDFVVKTSVNNCKKKNHEIVDIIAIIPCLAPSGEIEEILVPAGYCRTCECYYVLSEEFEKLTEKYVPLCRVIEHFEDIKKGNGIFSDFNDESIMHQYGYTVSQQSELSNQQRRTILEFLVASGILSKSEICAHLDWLIKSRQYDATRFKYAIEKWKSDRQYIASFSVSPEQRAVVQSIVRKIRKQ